MPLVRPTVGKLLAATLLGLCIGVAGARSVRPPGPAIQDTNDEAIIVMVVLCIGAASR
jgi:hypothetical protein